MQTLTRSLEYQRDSRKPPFIEKQKLTPTKTQTNRNQPVRIREKERRREMLPAFLVLNYWQASMALNMDDAEKFTNPFLSTTPHEVVIRCAFTSCRQCQNEKTLRRSCISRKGESVGIGLLH
uniref:Uncharacterized protein n=1 Tax=Nelumbo nucifera TaxID=4432 RepID=A0A822ZRM9_NELNU|nr:TPA_asm: hypothetical protein HUJ06_017470 [Nelumbo nucifera]